MTSIKRVAALVLWLCLGGSASALTNGFTLSPIGYQNYYAYFSGVSSRMMTNVSQSIHTNGLQALADEFGDPFFVNLGAHWSDGTLTGPGVPIANSGKFPAGIQPVADHVHSLGLKFGISGQGHESGTDVEFDEGISGNWTNCINQYVTWGMDWFNFDFVDNIVIGSTPYSAEDQTRITKNAIMASGRQVWFLIVNIPPQTWGPPLANCNRTSLDSSGTYADMLTRADDFNTKASLCDAGYINDADFLQIEIASQVLTATENKTHYALWCLLGTPLMWSNFMTNMAPSTLAYALNRDLYRIHRQPLANPGTRVSRIAGIGGNLDTWRRSLTVSGVSGVAVGCVNNSTVATNMTFTISDMGIASTVMLRDAMNTNDIGVVSGTYTAANIPSHGIAMFIAQTNFAGVLNVINLNVGEVVPPP